MLKINIKMRNRINVHTPTATNATAHSTTVNTMNKCTKTTKTIHAQSMAAKKHLKTKSKEASMKEKNITI